MAIGIIATALHEHGLRVQDLWEQAGKHNFGMGYGSAARYCRVCGLRDWELYGNPNARRAIEMALRDLGIEIEGINAGKEYDDEF